VFASLISISWWFSLVIQILIDLDQTYLDVKHGPLAWFDGRFMGNIQAENNITHLDRTLANMCILLFHFMMISVDVNKD